MSEYCYVALTILDLVDVSRLTLNTSMTNIDCNKRLSQHGKWLSWISYRIYHPAMGCGTSMTSSMWWNLKIEILGCVVVLLHTLEIHVVVSFSMYPSYMYMTRFKMTNWHCVIFIGSQRTHLSQHNHILSLANQFNWHDVFFFLSYLIMSCRSMFSYNACVLKTITDSH
jgi:hypothetical protein